MLGRAHVTDYSKYKSIVFIDTMVVLHGQPLDKQPWKEIDPFGPILVLIVPQVQTEIDKRKLDGRLSARARAFSRLIRPSVSKGGEPIQIVSGPPVVDIGMAFPKPIPWEKLDLDKGKETTSLSLNPALVRSAAEFGGTDQPRRESLGESVAPRHQGSAIVRQVAAKSRAQSCRKGKHTLKGRSRGISKD